MEGLPVSDPSEARESAPPPASVVPGSDALHNGPGEPHEGGDALRGGSAAPREEGDAPRDVLDTTAAGGMIIRGGALRFLSYIAIVLLSLIPAVLLTRHLGTAGFSAYTTIISLVSVIALVTDIGMSNLGAREYAVREGAERETLMRDLLGLRVALTLCGALLAMVFAVCAGYDAAQLGGTLVASLAMVALVLQHTLAIPLAVELRLGILSFFEVLRQALMVIGTVALIALGAGIFPLLAVMLVVYLLLVPMTAVLVRGKISLRMELRPNRWLQLLRPSLSFTLATAVGAIYMYTAQITTSVVASSHQSGLFALSFRVFFIAVIVPGMLVSGAIPLLARAARDDRERLAYALQRIFEVSLIMGAGAALAFAAAAPFIVEVVGGPKFAGAAPALRIQGVAMSASFLVAGWGYALLTLARYRAMLIVNVLALSVSFGLTLLLAATHGATGAAVATLCGELTLSGSYLAVLSRAHPELRPTFEIVPKVALAVAPAAVLVAVLQVPSVALTALALAIYGLVIVLTRAAPAEITELIPRPGRRRPAPQ
jgi:O-antigen/teichoic acid export membrane protein